MTVVRESRYLEPISIRGLNKVGDAMIPGDSEYPSFSKLGVSQYIDRVLEDVPAADRDGLKILFAVFGVLPGFFVRGIFVWIELLWKFQLPMGSILKQIRIGLRGIIFSLYYSGLKGTTYHGSSPVERMGYSTTVIRD